MKQNIDLRVQRTKKLLYDSLTKLMKDKTFEELKVAEICEQASINRSTFYTHYDDKFDLLIDYLESLKQHLLDVLSNNKNIINTKEFYLEMIKLIINHIDEHKDIYHSVIVSNRNSIVTDIIMDAAIKDINKRLEITNCYKCNVPTDIIVKFYLGAVTSIGLDWIINNNKYTKEEIFKYLDILIPNDIYR